MFIRNCWYVVAWDHEIPEDGLFARTVIGEPLVMYRTAAGEIVALEDRCCHRLAPLSAGRKEGDCVRCGYHGLKFAASGACVEVPGLDSVPPKARVRRYPVAVKNHWVFAWMGEGEPAPVDTLPDNFSCGDPEFRYKPGYLHYDTPWLLIADNLLDFSHLSYVHEKTLGGTPAIAQSRPTIENVPRGLRVSRHVPNVPPPPFYTRMRSFDGNIDRYFVYDFLLPATLLMHSGGRTAGSSEHDGPPLVRLHSCQALTPETENSTHYFFMQGVPGSQGGAELVDNIYASLVQAFNEDRDMITAQARIIAMKPEAPMLPLAMDAALVRFRRLVEEAIQAEAGR